MPCTCCQCPAIVHLPQCTVVPHGTVTAGVHGCKCGTHWKGTQLSPRSDAWFRIVVRQSQCAATVTVTVTFNVKLLNSAKVEKDWCVKGNDAMMF